MTHSLHSVLYSMLEFLFSAFIVLLITMSIFADVFMLDGSIGESTCVECVQAMLLFTIVQLYLRTAHRRPDQHAGLMLAGGFFLCMFIREMDAWLDYIHHGFWIYPALAAAVLCSIPALRRPKSALAGLHAITRHPSFGMLTSGLLCVLLFSRLFGMGKLWKQFMGLSYERIFKNAIEESLELFGYTLVFIAVLRFCGFPRWLEKLRPEE